MLSYFCFFDFNEQYFVKDFAANLESFKTFCNEFGFKFVHVGFKKVSFSQNLHYTWGIMPKHVTNSFVHLCGLAPGNTVLKKHCSSGEPLATVFVDQPGN